MNSLEAYIDAMGLDPIAVMNALQTQAPVGICSDLAVTPEDVGTPGAATAWVHEHLGQFVFDARKIALRKKLARQMGGISRKPTV